MVDRFKNVQRLNILDKLTKFLKREIGYKNKIRKKYIHKNIFIDLFLQLLSRSTYLC